MKAHSVNNLNNFIGGWYFDDLSLCDEIISYFKNKQIKERGSFLDGFGKVYNFEKKDSIDAILEDESLLPRYLLELQKIINEYKNLYVYCDINLDVWGIKEHPNIQYYEPPMGGYHQWHTERAGHPYAMNRHLVYMTYLNDVDDNGETEWFYQKIKIAPKKGLTLIWPVDWMFTHRGLRSPTQEKYIITGWYYFKESI